MTNDPRILAIAFFGGIIPSVFWLLFWLREDKKNPEPKGLLILVFIMGILTVLITLPVQKIVQSLTLSYELELIAWASIEEILKFLMVLIIVLPTHQSNEPTDWPIYIITLALGFAALENTMFLLKPLAGGDTVVGLLTGHLRFLGSTLLHTISSGIIGISMGLSFYLKSKFKIGMYVFIGVILSITLHSMFNFFIMKNGGSDFLKVFAFLWVGAIIVMLLFEKLRRMNLSTSTNSGKNN